MCTKTCTKCGKAKALSSFHADRSKPDGRRPVCKACRQSPSAKERKSLLAHGLKKCRTCQRPVPMERLYRMQCPDCRLSRETLERKALLAKGKKRCPHCNEIKSLDAFQKRPSRSGQPQSWCSSCKRVLNHGYRANNREKLNTDRRRYYRGHHNQELQRARNQRNGQQRKLAAKTRAYYWAHVEQCRQKSKAKQRPYTAARRAKLHQAEGTFTKQDLKKLYEEQEGKCFYCGDALDGAYHVDHVIPISRGGSNNLDNLQLLCQCCNLSKHDKTHDEYISWLALSMS